MICYNIAVVYFKGKYLNYGNHIKHRRSGTTALGCWIAFERYERVALID